MRRTALFLGGFLLASGASLALAGPAQAADSGCKRASCGSSSGLAVVHSAPRPTILVDDDCDDVLVYSTRDRYRSNRILVANDYYGGSLGGGGIFRNDLDIDGDHNIVGNDNQTFTIGDIDLGLLSSR
ncbi:hypothetical protein OHA21_22945 [Actinoplanes sp. NBC_00393]|uniref:hypothetical protein n=1 Tax=Actinoplanes sp. NBC_00393 TaxID=2975953 RepID=UPI002E245526